MTNKRYVLFKPTKAGESVGALEDISSLAKVIDSIGSRAYLVETTEASLDQLRERLPGWTIEEERIHPAPGKFP